MGLRRAAATALLLALVAPPAYADPLAGPPDDLLDNTVAPTFANGYGEGLAMIGDLDADGDDELAITVPGWSDDFVHDGAVLVHPGSPDGLAEDPVLIPSPEGAYSFGHAVSPAGDVDGDGFDDLLVSAYRKAFLVPGTPTGPGEPVQLDLSYDPAGTVTAVGAGDVDGDGFDDLLVGEPSHDGAHRDQGRVLLLHGSPKGPATPVELEGPERRRAHFGGGMAAAGDVNGDGLADLLVAATGWRARGAPVEGRGYVFLGVAGDLGPAVWHADPANYRRWDEPRPHFGDVLAGVGDVDGDGYDDVAFAMAEPQLRLRVYLGSPSGTTGPPVVRRERGSDAQGFGSSVSGVGDVDGDGRAEVVVGAPMANVDRVYEGRVYLYRGARAGLRERAVTRDPSNRKWAELGDHVAGGGDVDGDGSPDLAVSAPEYAFGSGRRGRVFVWR